MLLLLAAVTVSCVEVLVTELTVLNESKTPPFLIADDAGCSEDMRLTYRYLDIRRNPIKNALLLRNKVSRKRTCDG
jgi:aspartyl-tRNA synthetase